MLLVLLTWSVNSRTVRPESKEENASSISDIPVLLSTIWYPLLSDLTLWELTDQVSNTSSIQITPAGQCLPNDPPIATSIVCIQIYMPTLMSHRSKDTHCDE